MSADHSFDRLMDVLSDTLAQRPKHQLHVPFAIDVAAIRKQTGLSQSAFAARNSVPVGTIRDWEQGDRSPQGPARVLLALLKRNPRIVEETFAN